MMTQDLYHLYVFVQVQAARNEAEKMRLLETAIRLQNAALENKEKQQLLAEKEDQLLKIERSMNEEIGKERESRVLCEKANAELQVENESLKAQMEEMQRMLIKHGLSNLPD